MNTNTVHNYDAVIPGNVILLPKELDANISHNILKRCEQKYKNTILKLNGEYVVIINVKNIKLSTIESIALRESNNSTSRYYFKMVVNLLHIQEKENILCTVSMVNKYFIEARISLSKRVVVFIVIDQIEDNNDNNFTINSNGEVIIKASGEKIQNGDIINVECVEVSNICHDLVVISNLLHIEDSSPK